MPERLLGLLVRDPPGLVIVEGGDDPLGIDPIDQGDLLGRQLAPVDG